MTPNPSNPVPRPRRHSQQSVGDEAKVARAVAESRPPAAAAPAPPRSARTSKPREAAPAPPGAPAPFGAPAAHGDYELPPLPRRAEAQPEAAEDDNSPPLDAWHGSFTRRINLPALKQSRDKVAEFAPELVFADDDRQQVTATREFPWRCLCSLSIVAANGTRWVGTGWLAGPRTVVTAGHCVYLHEHGGWARRVEVYPGRNGADTSLGRYDSDDLHSVTGWTVEKNLALDYGAITLPQPLDLGWLSYGVYSDAELRALRVNLFGYPGDKAVGQLWGTDRRLTQVLPDRLVYDLSTFGGQSGAPVFHRDRDGQKDERVVVGIHNYGDVSGNTATRVTDAVFDDIEAWKKA